MDVTRTSPVSEGQRCQLHPGTDLWMRGARYGEVVAVIPMGNKPAERVRVRVDATGKVATFYAWDVLPIAPIYS